MWSYISSLKPLKLKGEEFEMSNDIIEVNKYEHVYMNLYFA